MKIIDDLKQVEDFTYVDSLNEFLNDLDFFGK